jgi:hypothetical protein
LKIQRLLPAAVLLAALAGGAAGAAELHGVLRTNSHKVRIDSALVVAGAPMRIPTPGWGGDPGVTDSFDFPPVSVWPGSVTLFVVLNDTQSVLMPFPAPVNGTWYSFRNVSPVAPEAMFWAPTGVAGGEKPARPAVALAVRPSVISGRAVFSLGLEGRGGATLEIFDAAGNPARRFEVAAGTGSLGWDGTDAAGNRLADGVYFCRLSSGDEVAVRKVLLAR